MTEMIQDVKTTKEQCYWDQQALASKFQKLNNDKSWSTQDLLVYCIKIIKSVHNTSYPLPLYTVKFTRLFSSCWVSEYDM